jgi:ketosteroid isomerase-like protein
MFMSQQNEALVHAAYQAYGRGDLTSLLALVHPDLEWTFLDPAFADPEPRTCHGRHQLERALDRQVRSGLTPAVEEIASSGDKVMVVIHTPGLDQRREQSAADRTFLVLTLRDEQIVTMRACHDRAEAAALTGLP